MRGGVGTAVVVEPEGYSPRALAALASRFDLVLGPFDRSGLLAATPGARVLVIRLAHEVDEEVLTAGEHLEYVCSPTTGVDHIDVERARALGVEVLTLRGEVEFLQTVRATPEHTWGLLLALARKIPVASRLFREWDRDRFRGTELAGRRLGIYGCGRVGRIVAGYGAAFDMEVFVHDIRPIDLPGVHEVDSLEDLLVHSDVFTVHVPLDEATKAVIGPRELALLPPGALLVNTARGGIIDEDALVDALQSDRLAGAAIDVIDGERSEDARSRSRLLGFAEACPERLVVTPHIAGATRESMHRTEEFLVEKLLGRVSGEPDHDLGL